jgi:hypothetical protein
VDTRALTSTRPARELLRPDHDERAGSTAWPTWGRAEGGMCCYDDFFDFFSPPRRGLRADGPGNAPLVELMEKTDMVLSSARTA